MTGREVIRRIEEIGIDKEVCIIVDAPNNAPRRVLSVEADDFDEIPRIGFVTNMEEVQ